jgi:hypothetical protein
MRSSFHSPSASYLKATLLTIQLALCFGGPSVAQAEGNDLFSPGPVRPGSDYRTDLMNGYLEIYSATGRLNHGDAPYFLQSGYRIYRINENLFKDVKYQRSTNENIPEVVALPMGTYLVEARSQRGGYVGMLAVIKEGQETILDLDLWETKTQKRLARN